jgi:predicted ATPase
VARICQLVEGMPLAIELAASSPRSQSAQAIAAALETNMAVLATTLRGIPERHRSMRSAFEHSWRLLSDSEQAVFARLSVFRGGFEADAAASVAGATPELLAMLLDKSLVRWDGVHATICTNYCGSMRQRSWSGLGRSIMYTLPILRFSPI